MRSVGKVQLKKGFNEIKLPIGSNVVGLDYLTLVYEFNSEIEVTQNRGFEVVEAGNQTSYVDNKGQIFGWTVVGLATASNAVPCVVYEFFQLM